MSDTLPIAFTTDERKMLIAAEQTIRLGLRTFLDVGEALAKIRDQRLYRGQFSTFEDYCQTRWDFSARRSRQLIGASDVVAALPMGTIVPVNEAQARVLVGLTPTEAAAVMEKADEETGGKLTATAIREVRNDWKRGQAASEDAISAANRPAAPPPDGKAYVRNGVPTSTGMQAISNAVPDVKQKPRRRPLPDQYHSAVLELQKAVERLERLHGDDRFLGHHKDLRDRYIGTISAMEELLEEIDEDLYGLNKCRDCKDDGKEVRCLPERRGGGDTLCRECRDLRDE